MRRSIKGLLTFKNASIDLLSLGGVIEAQAGSSGGAVVNAWGRLVGLLVTSSDAATTAERDLRALTASYIARDFEAEAGAPLEAFLMQDPSAQIEAYKKGPGKRLTDLLLAALR